MSQLMKVSSNPHVRSHITTSNIMLAVIIALLPAAGFGIYNFGLDALILRLFRSRHGTSACIKPAVYRALVDRCCRWYICNPCSKDAVWRSGAELYEPGTWCPVLSADFLHIHYV